MTSVTENEYKRIVSLYFKWCSALGLAREFTFEGLASWAWFYAQHFTQRSLAGHWSAMRLWCVANGRDFPADDSICWRRMTRVTKALRLRDPTTAIRAYPLETVWLRRMLAIDGIHTLSDMWSPELSLFRVVFWARVCTAHSAMLRACEHEQGLLNSHLTLLPAPDASARSAFSGSYFELAVGELPPGMKPIFASNRKLRLRAARDCVLLVYDDVTSAGMWLHVMLKRLYGFDEAPADLCLFPSVEKGRVGRRPMTNAALLKRLRRLARGAGLPQAELSQLELRSLRAGGCTEAFANGMPRTSVMRQGGWTSVAVDIYNRPSLSQRWRTFALFQRKRSM